MQSSNYHPLLLQQLGESIADSQLTPELRVLLAAVSNSYATFQIEQHLLEEEVAVRTQQLIASTSRAYSFLDSIHKGFIMCDTAGEVVLTNNSARRILSLKMIGSDTEEEPVMAVPIWSTDAIDGLLQPELQLKDMIHSCLASSAPLECDEVTFGKRVLRLYLAPLLTEGGTPSQQLLGVVILVEDITEQKVLERSKDEFLSIASHELRTPLTAIRGNASLIKKYYAASITDKDMGEMIDDIHASSTRLIEIVNDFLDAAAIEQGKITMNPETIQLEAVIQEVVRELQHLCEAKGITLTSQVSAPLPAVRADRQRIKQVIYNLVGNAVKFTDEGSITITARSDDEFIYTTVTDTGRGMPEDSQRLLFRKFQQAGSSLLTRDTTKGTGLGLYISKLIVELSGGQISLERSQPDQGSSFVFSLPREKISTAQS